MNTVITDFNTRVQEINGYFIFIESLIKETTKLAIIGSTDNYKIEIVDSELAKTLKANGFLLLYNLVESTMRNAIEAIFDEFHSKGIYFDKLKPEIKKTVLENLQLCLKKKSFNDLYNKISQISIDIVTVTFERERIFSGNVDAKVIKSFAKKYGFSCSTDCSKTKDGTNLLVIKNNRNDLAHGIKSFEEVGRDKSIDELLEIKQEVIEYLYQILENIQAYLNNKEYLNN